MSHFRFICLLLYTLLNHFSYAQQFSYRNFTPDNGFSSSEVYSILQDKMGYMWFATDHGVVRYNGNEFTIYTTSDGLVDNTILRIGEDSKGRIWMIGHNSEVCYWEKGRIITPAFSSQVAATFVAREAVQDFYIDRQDNLWINAHSSTLRISTSGKIYLEKQTKIENCHIPIKIIDEKRALYFFSQALPAKKNGSSFESGHLITKIGFELNDSLYYQTVNTEIPRARPSALVAYSPKNRKLFYARGNVLLTIERHKATEVKKFENNILDLSIDQANDLWIGFRRVGVSYYKNADLKNAPVSFLDNCSVNFTYRDKEGGVWLSTLDKGIFYVPSTSILNFLNVPFLRDKITFIGATKKNIFVKTFNTELHSGICNITTRAITIQNKLMDLQKKYSAFYGIWQTGDTIHAIYEVGIVLLAPDFKVLNPIEKRSTVAAVKRFIGSDSSFHYYLYTTGIIRIDKMGKPCSFACPFRIYCGLLKNNELLIGGKKGLYSFKNGKYTSLAYKDTLLKKSIIEMKEDADGRIWLATAGEGLLCLKDGGVLHFKKEDGLVSNVCTSLALDDYNNIWVGTTKGISQLKFTNKNEGWKIRNFTKEHGLNSNEITKLFADHDSLWIGTATGLSHAVISDISVPKPLCPVYIDSIKVNNTPIDTGKRSWSYKENNLKFKVSALTFVSQWNHLFRYRLIGLDSSWTETKTSELSFSRLPSGNFQFEIQAANPDKAWSQSAVYSFIIHTPFWLTWWFILLEVILLLVLIALIILFVVKRITRREKEKAYINKLLTEYQMKALTSQMNPHFIFNAINSIQNFILMNDGDIAYDYLEKFSRLIRTVLNNSEKKEVVLQDELDTMALYVELEQLRFENSFDYVCDIDEQLNTDEVVIPALIIQPYIENAIWHGLMPLTNHKGRISLLIKKQENKLKMILTDNGIGRQASDNIPKKMKSKNQESMGTYLTSSRIKLFGNDTTNSIRILDNYDDMNNAIGTTVEIILPFIEKY